MSITKGKLTFDAEGQEGGPFHSRVLHVPSGTSGLTIGRGYDMKEKRSSKIASDLSNAGVPADMAEALSRASGLSGEAARQFIEDNSLSGFEITPDAQETLFEATYAEMEADVRRICDKADCVAAYGAVDWEALNPAIKDALVDLRFRGDYHPTSRRLIQSYVANNDLPAFAGAISDRGSWQGVPQDRFNRRVNYVQEALA